MPPASKRPSLITRLLRFAARALLLFVGVTFVWALAYRWINPPTTFLMLRDAVHGRHVEQQWVGLDAIAKAVPRAVIGAEDAGFCAHFGFDFAAMEAAMARNANSKKLRGGSTISQQTAKNVFLWPGRSYVRKGLEAWFTALIELTWGKPRIMEVYLNVIEMGPGIFGVEAAAQHFFNTSAAKLSPKQAARLAAILPQPIKRDAADPGRYTKRYARRIEKRIRIVRNEGVDSCLR
ncbi:MAG: monofunctional biosynthetic peptidoglycan transglycosylase [Polymorphobacter sp.]